MSPEPCQHWAAGPDTTYKYRAERGKGELTTTCCYNDHDSGRQGREENQCPAPGAGCKQGHVIRADQWGHRPMSAGAARRPAGEPKSGSPSLGLVWLIASVRSYLDYTANTTRCHPARERNSDWFCIVRSFSCARVTSRYRTDSGQIYCETKWVSSARITGDRKLNSELQWTQKLLILTSLQCWRRAERNLNYPSSERLSVAT